MAYEALASVHVDDAPFIWKKALQDNDEYVKHQALQALEGVNI